jgi:hypothetical protein
VRDRGHFAAVNCDDVGGADVTVGFTGSFTSGKTSPPAFALNGRACG